MITSQEATNFIRDLVKLGGAASVRDLDPQTSQKDNSARQTCKRRGWVVYREGRWRITDAGIGWYTGRNPSK